jgi:hypothetical protein
MARGGYGTAAEQYVIERVNQLAGWSAVNANSLRANQPGFDVLTRHHSGRELRISVKSVSAGGKRHDYGIGRSFRTHPADVYAFVDLTGPQPWPVYLAGARTVEALALERHPAVPGRPGASGGFAEQLVSQGQPGPVGGDGRPRELDAARASRPG